MANRRPRYTAEFQAQMIALVRSGRSPESLGKEFPSSARTVSAGRDAASDKDTIGSSHGAAQRTARESGAGSLCMWG